MTLKIPWPAAMLIAANAISPIDDPFQNVMTVPRLPPNVNVEICCCLIDPIALRYRAAEVPQGVP